MGGQKRQIGTGSGGMEPEAELMAPQWPRPLLDKLRLHPGLSQLAAALEENGPIPAQRRDLRQAEAGLARSRAAWLAHEALWAGLQELLRKPRPPGATQPLAAVEEALSLAELRRTVPGLADLMPHPPLPLAVRRPLLELLEAQMGLKVAELQHYSHGVSNGAGCGVGHGAGSVREELLQEQCRLRRLKERRWQLLVLLERNCRGCVQAQLRCSVLLGQLKALQAQQAKVERCRGRYLQAKAAAMLLKARLEELTLLAETYSPEHLEAHSRIRSHLQAALSRTQTELEGLREALGTLVAIGPHLVATAEEYRQLRDDIRHRQWALQHLGGRGDINGAAQGQP